MIVARYFAIVAATLAATVGSVVWLYCAFLVLVFRAGDYCEDYGSCTEGTPLAIVQAPVALAGIVALWVLAVRFGGVVLARWQWPTTWIPATALSIAVIVWFGVVMPTL